MGFDDDDPPLNTLHLSAFKSAAYHHFYRLASNWNLTVSSCVTVGWVDYGDEIEKWIFTIRLIIIYQKIKWVRIPGGQFIRILGQDWDDDHLLDALNFTAPKSVAYHHSR